jgi:hypothetical protein
MPFVHLTPSILTLYKGDNRMQDLSVVNEMNNRGSNFSKYTLYNLSTTYFK